MQTGKLTVLDRRTGKRHLLELHRDPRGEIVVYLEGKRVTEGPASDWEPQETEGLAFDIWMEWCQRERDFIE
jgi:hypothetical protein